MTTQMKKARLPAKIADAMREHLPEEISITLRERLEEADEALDENATMKRNIAGYQEREETTRQLNAREKLIKEQEAEIIQIAGDCAESLRDLKVRELEQELSAERRISAVFESALAGMVRNIEWRERVEIGRENIETLATPQTTTKNAE